MVDGFAMLMNALVVLCLCLSTAGETWRAAVKEVLMGRAAITARGKFHKAEDVAALFAAAGQRAPEVLAKSAWWFFAGITLPGGAAELEGLYSSVLQTLAALDRVECPEGVSEGDAVPIDEALLEGLVRLWPALTTENA